MSVPVSILNEYSGEDEGLRFVLARILGELNRQELLISGGTNDLGEETAGNPTSDGGEGTAVDYLTEASLAAYLADNGFTAGASGLSFYGHGSNTYTVPSGSTSYLIVNGYGLNDGGSPFTRYSFSLHAKYVPGTVTLSGRYSIFVDTFSATGATEAAGSFSLALTSSYQNISSGVAIYARVSGSTITINAGSLSNGGGVSAGTVFA